MKEEIVKPGLKEFDAYLRKEFSKRLRESYEELQILSEADLQAHAWILIRQFFERFEETSHRFRVLNKPYFKKAGIHPDLGVFKRQKPWVLIELKERRKVLEKHARTERDRHLAARKTIGPKRVYLIYVSRYGGGQALTGPKGKAGKYFFEIAITLEETWTVERIRDWEADFKRWSKFVPMQA
jgi:hypothetical protein